MVPARVVLASHGLSLYRCWGAAQAGWKGLLGCSLLWMGCFQYSAVWGYREGVWQDLPGGSVLAQHGGCAI